MLLPDLFGYWFETVGCQLLPTAQRVLASRHLLVTQGHETVLLIANCQLLFAISCTPPALLTCPDAIDGLGPGLYQSGCGPECAAPLLRSCPLRFPAAAG